MSDPVKYRRSGEGPPDAVFTGADGAEIPGWLPDRKGRAPRRPARYVLADGVGGWYGITGTAVAMLIRRRPGAPPHTAELAPEAQGKPSLAWAEDSRMEWDAYRGSMPGQGAKGRPKPGSGNRAVVPRRRFAAGPAALDALLASYPLAARVPEGLRMMKPIDATGGRLVVAGTGAGRVAYARDQADAAAASKVAPELKFGPT